MSISKDKYPKNHEFEASVSRELSCSICVDLFVSPQTLSCGHTFCELCLTRWLAKSLSCPLCRNDVKTPPYDSLAVSHLVRSVLVWYSFSVSGNKCRFEDIDEKNILQQGKIVEESNKKVEEHELKGLVSYFRRRDELSNQKKKSEKQQVMLETFARNAQMHGFDLVTVHREWSKQEQRRFLAGIKNYLGVARVSYCAAVKLTPEYIAKASVSELAQVCKNLCFKPPKKYISDDGKIDYESWISDKTLLTRQRLSMYVSYG
eukprot:snap_masked-scaffold_40-processed-gene-0.48-mRNA-1 protein AED:0.35 eAED:0.35 QI:0/-1/0/1/-1/1/1/0/260